MRYIRKKESPEPFERWKNKMGDAAHYGNIPAEIKCILRKSLLDEQNWLCCYCGLSLMVQNTHIEHFRPQSKFRDLQLDYRNLHASCNGRLLHLTEYEGVSDFCGHAKKDWFDEKLLISPLDPNCESLFEYGFDGSVRPNHSHIGARETIWRLGLDSYLLRRQREEAINAVFELIDIFNDEELQDMISFLETPDDSNRLPSFSYIMSGLLKTLVS